MNLRAIRLMLAVSIGVALLGMIARNIAGLEFLDVLIPIGTLFSAASAGILIRAQLSMAGDRKLGSESIPPATDVAAIFVGETALPDEQKARLLKAIYRARRATICGKVEQSVSFHIVDRWNGTWHLEAYREKRRPAWLHRQSGGIRGKACGHGGCCIGV